MKKTTTNNNTTISNNNRGKTEGVAANTVKVAVAEGVGEEEGTGLLAAHLVGRGPRPRALAPEPLEVVGVGAQEVGTTDACSTPKSPCQRPSRWEQIFPTMPAGLVLSDVLRPPVGEVEGHITKGA